VIRTSLLSALAALLAVTGFPADALAFGPSTEFTPFAGYRIAGDFRVGEEPGAPRADVDDGASWGVDIGLYRDAQSYYQLLYSRREAKLRGADPALQGTDLRIEYLHFGGTLLFPQPRGYTTYFSVTVGLTRLDAGASGYDAERKFSASVGGGFRFPLTGTLEATLGVRGYMTFFDRDSDIVCVSGDGGAGCLLRTSGRSVWEAEGIAGLTFLF
jgi:hypothetical protein